MGVHFIAKPQGTIDITADVDKSKEPLTTVVNGSRMSGRLDSNQRPPEPHSGALAKLRHAPILKNYSRSAFPLQEPLPFLFASAKQAIVRIVPMSERFPGAVSSDWARQVDCSA